MPEYKYISEAEREWTQKYEGVYMPEEIELNQQLYEECREECHKDQINFERVEELLKQGADPLGGTAIYGWDLLEHIYGELVFDSQDSDGANIPELTELFLKYGMNIETPRIPYDSAFSLNPLWDFIFSVNENTAAAMKMLLDHGISASSFAEFWENAITDFFHLECGDPQNDVYWHSKCVWTFKMLLLGASYDHIFQNDTGIGEFICCSFNTNDIHLFRNWNDFEYFFDTSYCDRRPDLYGSILHIYCKKTGKEVWTIGVGTEGQKTLEKIKQGANL